MGWESDESHSAYQEGLMSQLTTCPNRMLGLFLNSEQGGLKIVLLWWHPSSYSGPKRKKGHTGREGDVLRLTEQATELPVWIPGAKSSLSPYEGPCRPRRGLKRVKRQLVGKAFANRVSVKVRKSHACTAVDRRNKQLRCIFIYFPQ